MIQKILTSWLVTILLLPLSCPHGSAQVLVSSAGSSHQTQNISLSWSLGETATLGWFNQDFGITQGFHQPRMYTESVMLLAEEMLTPVASPNPTSGQIYLSGLPAGLTCQISLLDLTGRSRWSATSQTTDLELDAGTLPAGLYILRVCCEELSLLTHIKIILQSAQ